MAKLELRSKETIGVAMTEKTEENKPVNEEEILVCDCGRLLLLEEELLKFGPPIVIGADLE